jgi:hypothetical protein
VDVRPGEGIWGLARFLSEEGLFPVREGAFYGRLLGARALVSGLSVSVDPITRQVSMVWGREKYVKVQQGDVGDGVWYRLNDDGTLGMPALPQVPGSVYPEMYSCGDPEWTNSVQSLPGRVCALPGAQASCAAQVQGSCVGGAAPVCALGDGPPLQGDGDFASCRGGGRTWERPLTTFLYSEEE